VSDGGDSSGYIDTISCDVCEQPVGGQDVMLLLQQSLRTVNFVRPTRGLQHSAAPGEVLILCRSCATGKALGLGMTRASC
jgi:hypothetical protein